MAEKKTKNLYQKLAEIRAKISVKKTGVNKYAKYKYYEIDAIYSQAKKLFDEYKIFTFFNLKYNADNLMLEGVLTVVNADNPDEQFQINVDSPVNTMKGCSPAQEIGSNITYQSKYAYMVLLLLDDGANDPDKNNDHKEQPKKITPEQYKKIQEIVKARNIEVPVVLEELAKTYKVKKSQQLSYEQAVKFIEWLSKYEMGGDAK